MKPDRPGIYWVKQKFWIDRSAGETKSDWMIASWDEENEWNFIGDEVGLGNDHIVDISSEVMKPTN